MKNTSRSFAALLVLVLACSFSGCSAAKSSSAASESSSLSSASVSGLSGEDGTETTASVVMGSVVSAVSAAEAVSSAAVTASSGSPDLASGGLSSVSGEDTAAVSAAEEPDTFDAGTNTPFAYRNAYFGIRFRLPAGWAFAEESQLEEMNQAVSDKTSAEEIRSALSEGQTWFDMYATSDDGYQNLNITVQNIKAVYGALADIDTLVDTSLAPLQAALEEQGAEDISVRKGTMEFAGETAVCTRISGTIQGIPFYETQVYMKEGSYILCATAVSYSEDRTDSVLETVSRI